MTGIYNDGVIYHWLHLGVTQLNNDGMGLVRVVGKCCGLAFILHMYKYIHIYIYVHTHLYTGNQAFCVWDVVVFFVLFMSSC